MRASEPAPWWCHPLDKPLDRRGPCKGAIRLRGGGGCRMHCLRLPPMLPPSVIRPRSRRCLLASPSGLHPDFGRVRAWGPILPCTDAKPSDRVLSTVRGPRLCAGTAWQNDAKGRRARRNRACSWSTRGTRFSLQARVVQGGLGRKRSTPQGVQCYSPTARRCSHVGGMPIQAPR